MPPRKASRMFRVVVLAGVSLAACGGKEDSEDTQPPAQPPYNPPSPYLDAGPDVTTDAGADAPADARDEQMPAIK